MTPHPTMTPPEGTTATPVPTEASSGPTPTIIPPLSPTSTLSSDGGYPPPPSKTPAPTSSGGYPPPSGSTFTPTPTITLSPTLSPTPTIDPLFTPSTTPITPSPTVTLTPNPNFTATITPTPTTSRTPTRTSTPTRTPGPSPTPSLTLTPTPALPDLTTLIMDTGDLNAISNLWDDPPEDIMDDLQELNGELCEVACIGLEWISLDTFDTLVLTAYRTADFDEASQIAYSAQFLYLAQDFELEPLPPGTILPDHAWAASKWNRDFVIYTSQGPAVLSFFWHADYPISAQGTIALLAEYMEMQAEVLRVNGYITVDPNATPPP